MVSQLRRRLVLSGDLAADREKGDLFDADVTDAVRGFQRRHGLVPNGVVGPQTLRALNVPASKRVLQLRGSLHRLSDTDFTFAPRQRAKPACSQRRFEPGYIITATMAEVSASDRRRPRSRAPVLAILVTFDA